MAYINNEKKKYQFLFYIKVIIIMYITYIDNEKKIINYFLYKSNNNLYRIYEIKLH